MVSSPNSMINAHLNRYSVASILEIRENEKIDHSLWKHYSS